MLSSKRMALAVALASLGAATAFDQALDRRAILAPPQPATRRAAKIAAAEAKRARKAARRLAKKEQRA
jgi:hypothetical protein